MADKYAANESWKTGSSLRRERMAAYMEWLLSPPSMRSPSTKKDLAASLDVDTSTLHRYENDRFFQEEYQRRRRGLFKVADAEKVISTLVEIATDVSNRNAVTAARTLLEWMDKEKPMEQGRDLETFSDEELTELIKDELKRRNENQPN